MNFFFCLSKSQVWFFGNTRFLGNKWKIKIECLALLISGKKKYDVQSMYDVDCTFPPSLYLSDVGPSAGLVKVFATALPCAARITYWPTTYTKLIEGESITFDPDPLTTIDRILYSKIENWSHNISLPQF